jgi:flagellar protein FlaG
MNVNSISTGNGLLPHDRRVKTGPSGFSTAKSDGSESAQVVGLKQSNYHDAFRRSQPIVNGTGLSLEFSVDADTGTHVIKVIDRNSGDVVRQIPPEEVLAFLRQLQDSKGNFVSRKL